MEVVKTVPFNEYFDLKKEVDYLRSLVAELSDKLNTIDRQNNKEFKVKSIFIKTNGLGRYINIKDIIMIKADSNYSHLYLLNGESFLTSKTLKYWQEKCADPFLQRIHKSYLINTAFIVSVEQKTGKVNMVNGHLACSSRSSRLK
jgi:two-component system LytT family response regulator